MGSKCSHLLHLKEAVGEVALVVGDWVHEPPLAAPWWGMWCGALLVGRWAAPSAEKPLP
jgi:hypothetical protein